VDPHPGRQHQCVPLEVADLPLVGAHACILEPLRQDQKGVVVGERVQRAARREVELRPARCLVAEHRLEEVAVRHLVGGDQLENAAVSLRDHAAGHGHRVKLRFQTLQREREVQRVDDAVRKLTLLREHFLGQRGQPERKRGKRQPLAPAPHAAERFPARHRSVDGGRVLERVEDDLFAAILHGIHSLFSR
jgi:hypothetical protein